MLTKVRLDGVMGKKFGKSWDLAVSSPAEALRMIEANKPGLRAWIISNQQTYDAYKIVCVYADGREELLDENTFPLQRGGLKMIRFTPVVAGASAVTRIIVGAVMIAASFLVPGAWSPYLFKIGTALVLGGVIEALSPRPKTRNDYGEQINSYYFNGPANTDQQGAAVPLIYGRVLVGSHPISASISIDEVAPA
jgi:predicted phage tail protein